RRGPHPRPALQRAEQRRPRVGRLLQGLPSGDLVMPFDWERVFGRIAPHVIDVGCGTGRFAIEAAAANPGRDYLGIESIASLVEQASRDAIRRGLPNARFVAADAAG